MELFFKNHYAAFETTVDWKKLLFCTAIFNQKSSLDVPMK